MQLRSFILVAGTMLAIITPVASAQIAPDPLNETSQPLKAVKAAPHDYAGLDKKVTRVSTRSTSGPTSENSYGASLPQTRPVGSGRANTIRRTTRVVAPMIAG